MRKLLTRISGLPQITPPFKGASRCKGVVRLIFGCSPLLFPLSSYIDKIQTGKVPFSPEDPLCLLAFDPIYFVDPVFFLFYTLSIKKEILIKKLESETIILSVVFFVQKSLAVEGLKG